MWWQPATEMLARWCRPLSPPRCILLFFPPAYPAGLRIPPHHQWPDCRPAEATAMQKQQPLRSELPCSPAFASSLLPVAGDAGFSHWLCSDFPDYPAFPSTFIFFISSSHNCRRSANCNKSLDPQLPVWKVRVFLKPSSAEHPSSLLEPAEVAASALWKRRCALAAGRLEKLMCLHLNLTAKYPLALFPVSNGNFLRMRLSLEREDHAQWNQLTKLGLIKTQWF